MLVVVRVRLVRGFADMTFQFGLICFALRHSLQNTSVDSLGLLVWIGQQGCRRGGMGRVPCQGLEKEVRSLGEVLGF